MELYIGNTLKKLRLTKGLTQEEVATQLGISPQSISKWERGDGYPDITMLPEPPPSPRTVICVTGTT